MSNPFTPEMLAFLKKNPKVALAIKRSTLSSTISRKYANAARIEKLMELEKMDELLAAGIEPQIVAELKDLLP